MSITLSSVVLNPRIRQLATHCSAERSSKTRVLFPSSHFRSRTRVSRSRKEHGRGSCLGVQAAMGAMEEATFLPDFKPWETQSFLKDSFPRSPQAPSRTLFPNDRADDLSLANPLKRLERLGCGWLAVLLEWEGVVVEDDSSFERKAWAALAEEEGRPQPPGFLLRRAEGMKNEQVIREVLCWSRDFLTVRRLAQRKEELYEQFQGGCYRLLPGSREFVETLKRYDIPIAVVSTRPAKYLERAIEAVGMEGFFDVVISAEDVQRGKPDPEMFQYAAQHLQFIPERCVVIGSSNSSVEAAHDAFMKVVTVVGKHPAYELGASDLVVRRLDDLSMVDLKNLADLDSPEFTPPEPQPEPEPEPLKQTSIATMDRWP